VHVVTDAPELKIMAAVMVDGMDAARAGMCEVVRSAVHHVGRAENGRPPRAMDASFVTDIAILFVAAHPP
jgi:hypothetical protein